MTDPETPSANPPPTPPGAWRAAIRRWFADLREDAKLAEHHIEELLRRLRL